MKVLLLIDSNSPHAINWVHNLNDEVELHLFTLSNTCDRYYKDLNVKIYSCGENYDFRSKSLISKIKYLIALPKLKKVIKEINPDVIHAHYASSYGFLAMLAGCRYGVSVWGSDIYRFPRKSFIHKWILSKILKKSIFICSTSNDMKKEASKYVEQSQIELVPFGVNTEKFKPKNKSGEALTIGFVKTISDVYGVKDLIEVYCDIKKDINLKLLLVGGGDQLQYYKSYVEKNNISDVEFTGYIDNSHVNELHSRFDLELFLSNYEAFGVSSLEAQSCGVPVIVNNVGGLPETVNGDYCKVVDKNNKEELKEVILKYLKDEKYRKDCGTKAREWIIENFDNKLIAKKMISIYRNKSK